MDIPIGAKVICSEGNFGKVSHILINPITQNISHIVACDENLVSCNSRIVPFSDILETTPNMIRLRCSRDNVLKMADFIKANFIENEEFDPHESMMSPHMLAFGESEEYLLWPYMTATYDSPYIRVEEEQIPPGEMAVRWGADVCVKGKTVGQVDEFIVDPDTGHITHLVMREGHLWGSKDIALPIAVVEKMQEDFVDLKIDQEAIATLPKLSVRRFHKINH